MDSFIADISCQAISLSFPYKDFKNLLSNEKEKTKPKKPPTLNLPPPSMLSVTHAK